MAGFAGCAGGRASLGHERPEAVALVVRSEAENPAAQRALEEILGPERPEAILDREVARLLRARGYRTPPRAEGVATLELVLTRLDVSALRTLGQVELDLTATLRGAGGAILWQGSRTGPTPVQIYRAQNDWAAHLRTAARQLLGSLP